MHASEANAATLISADYWRQLCPDLHVTEQRSDALSQAMRLSKSSVDDLRRQASHWHAHTKLNFKQLTGRYRCAIAHNRWM
jgi:hypothetical protein